MISMPESLSSVLMPVLSLVRNGNNIGEKARFVKRRLPARLEIPRRPR